MAALKEAFKQIGITGNAAKDFQNLQTQKLPQKEFSNRILAIHILRERGSVYDREYTAAERASKPNALFTPESRWSRNIHKIINIFHFH